MEWDGIDEVVAVATWRTFTAAAAALGVSTSHISRAVARLEERLQTALFVRTTRRVTLTQAGKALIPRLRALVEERDIALAEAGTRGSPRGELKITCSVALGERFVAPLARAFAFAHEGVTVSLDLSNRVSNIVEEGYDLAIRTGWLPNSDLITTKIAERRLTVCATPAYIGSRGEPRTIEALSTHECLEGAARVWYFSRGGEECSMRPNGRWRCNSGVAVLDAALLGLGICQLPDFYTRPHLASGELVELLTDCCPDPEPIWAVYPHRKYLLPRVRSFVGLLQSSLPGSMTSDHVR